MIFIPKFYLKGVRVPTTIKIVADNLENACKVLSFMVESNDPEIQTILFDRYHF
jgi:hypothetical protein